jgi:hypothetical protein
MAADRAADEDFGGIGESAYRCRAGASQGGIGKAFRDREVIDLARGVKESRHRSVDADVDERSSAIRCLWLLGQAKAVWLKKR